MGHARTSCSAVISTWSDADPAVADPSHSWRRRARRSCASRLSQWAPGRDASLVFQGSSGRVLDLTVGYRRCNRRFAPEDVIRDPRAMTLRLLLLAVLALMLAPLAVLAIEREYYWNDVTNHTTWDLPKVPVPFRDENSGNKYYLDPKTGETTWDYPGPWKTMKSEEHGDREYYHNTETKESTWEKPEDLGWRRVKVQDDEL